MGEYISWLRSIVGHDLVLLPTTACILLDSEDRVLMQCRTDNRMWSCPGGILDRGETIRENVVREVLEETGLVVGKLELFGAFAGPEFYYTYPNGDQTAIVQFAFLCREFRGVPRIDEESYELRFFPAQALPSPITNTHQGFLKHLPDWLEGRVQLPIVL